MMVCVLGTEQRVEGPEAGFCENAYKLSGGIKGCVISALGGQLSVCQDRMPRCLNVFFSFTLCNKQRSMNTCASFVKYC
jgi:hypothetical protein